MDTYRDDRRQGRTRVYIVRHGQTNWNIERILQGHKDIPLNETGVLQAAKLGEFMEDVSFPIAGGETKVVSSDLTRCRETLDELLKTKSSAAGLKVVYTPDLRERFMGEVEGMKIDAAKEKYGDGFRNLGETSGEMLERLMRCWEQDIIGDESKTDVVVCTHGGVIRHLCKQLLQTGYVDETDGGVVIGSVPYNTSVTVVEVERLEDGSRKGRFLRYADTVHLGGRRVVDARDSDLR